MAERRQVANLGYHLDAIDCAESNTLDQLRQLHSAVVGIPVGPAATDAESGPGEARRFPESAEAPKAARRFVLETMAGSGWDDQLGDMALVMAELATNAVVHARSDFTVGVSLLPDVVRVSVRDASGVPPIPRDPDDLAGSGRGLDLLGALSDSWGVELFGDSKVVWAEFRR